VLVVDTGPLVATADRDDPDHDACRALLEGAAVPLVTTGMVVAEAAFLIARQLGPLGEVALYTDIVEGRLVVETFTAPDWERVRELVEQYADLPLGGTDASVVSLAERHRATAVATLGHRHFRVVRPAHLKVFELFP
jgi:predicted nucleic acid-binding protein